MGVAGRLIYTERWLLFGGREAKGCSCKGERSVLERLSTEGSCVKWNSNSCT